MLNLLNVFPDLVGRVWIEPLQDPSDYRTWAAVIPYLAACFLVWAACYAATQVSVKEISQGKLPTVGASVETLSPHSGEIILSALLIGAVVSIGLTAFYIPGIFLFSRYMFVPAILVLDSAPSLMVALNRSWRFSGKRPFASFLFVLIVVSLGYLLPMGMRRILVSPEGTFLSYVCLAAEVTISLAIETFAAIWTANYFLALKAEESK